MTGTIRNFEDLIAPLSGQRFMNDYYDRAWLHLPGDAERTEPLMSKNSRRMPIAIRRQTATTSRRSGPTRKKSCSWHSAAPRWS